MGKGEETKVTPADLRALAKSLSFFAKVLSSSADEMEEAKMASVVLTSWGAMQQGAGKLQPGITKLQLVLNVPNHAELVEAARGAKRTPKEIADDVATIRKKLAKPRNGKSNPDIK